jgi:hypothetical protein
LASIQEVGPEEMDTFLTSKSRINRYEGEIEKRPDILPRFVYSFVNLFLQ